MHASYPETIYSAGSGDWTQARLITVSGSAQALCQWAIETVLLSMYCSYQTSPPIRRRRPRHHATAPLPRCSCAQCREFCPRNAHVPPAATRPGSSAPTRCESSLRGWARRRPAPNRSSAEAGLEELRSRDPRPLRLRHLSTNSNDGGLVPTWYAAVRLVMHTRPLHCALTFDLSELNVGTPVTPASGKVYPNFGISKPFCFRVRSPYFTNRQADERTDGQDP